MSDYLLLTGATGLLGEYLMRDLLLDGVRLAVVARQRKSWTAEDRIEDLLQRWEEQLGRELPRPVCLEGEITSPDLGLSRQDRNWVGDHCRRVLHNAAILQFEHTPHNNEPFHTNVDGTTHFLDLCRVLGVEELHHVSTAYVCGRREGVIREDELDKGQAFRNAYEESKCHSEQAVRAANWLKSTTIYRPGVIAGDSVTGYTSTYHGLYLYLKLMFLIARSQPAGEDGVVDTPIRLNMTGDERRNIVPVDWVSRVISHLVQTPDAHGRTFHLTPDVALTPREIIEVGYRLLNSRGVEFLGAAESIRDPNDLERATVESTVIYHSYETSDPVFDRTNLKTFAGHLPCPRIDDDMLVRFCRYAEADHWGKRRPDRPQIPLRAEDLLKQRWPEIDINGPDCEEGESIVGLDCSGPGGGQWQVSLRNGVVVSIARGLPRSGAPVISVTTDRLSQLLASAQIESLAHRALQYAIMGHSRS